MTTIHAPLEKVSSGEAFFTGSTWKGHRVMRISVCIWRTTEEDVERVVRAGFCGASGLSQRDFVTD